MIPRVVCSAGGTTAFHCATKHGFEDATTDESQIFENDAIQIVFVATPHNLHARQVNRAIRNGKHVFVEKPICLTTDQLAEIQATIDEHGDETPLVMVGFNRRFAPATQQVRRIFANDDTPLTVSFRFNAGALPSDHWTQDPAIGGGRIIGEACHAIDTATFLVGSPPVRVFAESIGGPSAPKITDDQSFITLRHANGSISNIAYLAGGDRAFPKERIEIIGAGKVAVIDDFRTVTTSINGKIKTTKGRQDKGHSAEIAAFTRAVRLGEPCPISWHDIRAVTLASLLAVRSLREGLPFEIS